MNYSSISDWVKKLVALNHYSNSHLVIAYEISNTHHNKGSIVFLMKNHNTTEIIKCLN